MQLNLHRLWIFLKVVECGGFSAAANHLYMSQPSVSNQVRQLERSLHATLIDRSGNRIRATAEGELLIGYAERVFALADEAVDAIEQLTTLRTGRLLVGATPEIGTSLLPGLLAGFAREHPGVDTGSFVGTRAQVLEQLSDGALALVLLSGEPPGPPLVSRLLDTHRLTPAPHLREPEPSLRAEPSYPEVHLVHRRDRLPSPAEQAFATSL